MTLHCPNCHHVLTPPARALTERQAERDRRCRFNFQSLATVHEHLTNLERKGFIRRSYNETRAIEVLVRADDAGLPA